MKFARIVFSTAGALGILAMIPMYLAPGSNRYYGSLGGLVAWQFAFFVIATDPVSSTIPPMAGSFTCTRL